MIGDALFTGLPADLAEALLDGRAADALAATEQLVHQAPDDARLWYLHGVLLRQNWRMDEAIDAHQRSIGLGYAGAGPYRELFTHLEKRGRIGDALDCWRLAEERGYSDARFHSRALDAWLKDPETTSDELLEAHRGWAQRYAQPDPRIAPLQVEPFAGGRPVRVGYVCSVWEAPTIRVMLLPVLKRHDPKRVLATLYVNGPLMMGETWRELYEPHAAAVREVFRLTDRQFVEQVRADDIDVLVDLNGHSASHRFAAMASRCAPAQAVYLNYTSTTAVPNIDYVIGDRWTPEPGTEQAFTERVARLAGCFFCFDYRDDPRVPTPAALRPSAQTGRITFGSFGATTKINAVLINWWCEILRRVPGSTLFIRNFEMSPEDNRRALERQFVDRGIDASRLRLAGKGTRLDVVKSYDEVDIALDTFPYCGGNTTAEALWQGVPVVTLQGGRFSSSYGASLVRAAGAPELIARTSEEYVELAVALAAEPERLASYRLWLRSQMEHQGLGNADIFTPQFEDALIAMRTNVASGSSRTPQP